jgi:hypothetical protein
MSRRIANTHKIVDGAWRKDKPKTPGRTRANKARIYFAYPPETGWPGGAPEANGLRRKAAK